MTRLLLRTPISLHLLLLALVLVALTAVPVLGLAFFLMAAFLWTGPLINFAMIGLFIEPMLRHFAPEGARISFFWMIFPLIYAGWFGITFYGEKAALEDIREQFDSINAGVDVPYDPSKHSLVFEADSTSLAFELVKNFGIPKVYFKNEQDDGEYYSLSLLKKSACDEFRANKVLRAASISITNFHDNNILNHSGARRQLVTDFCTLSMPDHPQKAKVAISLVTKETEAFGVPGRFTKTIVTMPEGSQHTLRGGSVKLLTAPPRPMLGCGFNSHGQRTRCGGGFLRDRSAQVTSGNKGDDQVLATALGLERVAYADTNAPNSALNAQALREILNEALEQDLVYYRMLVSDPSNDPAIRATGAIDDRPDLLVPFAPEIVEGILKASRPHGEHINSRREEGLRLARAFDKLPPEERDKYAKDFAELYARLDEIGDGRHWVYKMGSLMQYRKAPRVVYAPPSLTAE